MATDSIEYKIVLIDSENVHYNNNNPNIYDFYVDILEPLRDVYKIKVLYDGLSIPTTNLLNNNTLSIKNLDTVYITLNGYSRIKTTLIDIVNDNKNNIDLSFFDSITIDLNKIKLNAGINETTMFNDFNVNEADFILNPVASQFNKIFIQLKDKNNNLLTKSFANRFFMKLCIYYKTKKISRF